MVNLLVPCARAQKTKSNCHLGTHLPLLEGQKNWLLPESVQTMARISECLTRSSSSDRDFPFAIDSTVFVQIHCLILVSLREQSKFFKHCPSNPLARRSDLAEITYLECLATLAPIFIGYLCSVQASGLLVLKRRQTDEDKERLKAVW